MHERRADQVLEANSGSKIDALAELSARKSFARAEIRAACGGRRARSAYPRAESDLHTGGPAVCCLPAYAHVAYVS
jgi:hypothetical protein